MARKPQGGPASDPELLILASLANGSKHGYAILADVETFSGSRLGPGTLYTAITRLVEKGWIMPGASKWTAKTIPDHRVGCGMPRTAAERYAKGRKDRAGKAARRMNTMKRTVVAVLLRLYPARWRQEYGAELGGILVDRRLGFQALFDIVCSAMTQQLRIGEPWLIVGAPLLVLNLAMVIWNILNPWTYADDTLQASLTQKLWFWLPELCVGCWTVLRNPGLGRGGRAAMKTTLLTSWPVSAIAVFAAIGILKIVTLGPGDLPGTFSHNGLAITLYDSARRPTHAFPLFMLPILNLPFAALGGWFGGLLARAWLRMERV